MLLPDNFCEIFELVKCKPVLMIIAIDYIEPCPQKALDVYSWLMLSIHISYRRIEPSAAEFGQTL